MRIGRPEHPLLDAACFVAALPGPLGDLGTPASWGFPPSGSPDADDSLRADVRDLLRAGGFKPTGRSKPASEYLLRAVGDGALAPINPVVDACNLVSWRSGLPISVVDLDLTRGDLRIDVAPAGTGYVFNRAGQELDVGGLLCLWDADGPCANAVKDSQRTKTHPGTTRVAAVVWGTAKRPGLAADVATRYRALLHELGAATEGA